MNPHHQLIQYLERVVALNDSQKQLLQEKFVLRKFKKRTFIFNEGEPHRYNTFVLKGALRLFALDDAFREYSLHFAFENYWTGDLESFVKGTPSELCLQAFEDTVVLQITHEDLNEVLEAIPAMYKPWMLAFQNALMRANKQILDNIGSTAEARHEDFLTVYKNQLNRLPDKYIASYIGVTPEFYSKLKRESLRKYLKLD